MGKCAVCGIEEFNVVKCSRCGRPVCIEHRLPENHNCDAMAGRFRRRGEISGQALYHAKTEFYKEVGAYDDSIER